MSDSPFLLTPGPVPVPPAVLAVQSEPAAAPPQRGVRGDLRRGAAQAQARLPHGQRRAAVHGLGHGGVRVGLREPRGARRSRAVRHGGRVRRPLGGDGARLRRRCDGAGMRVGPPARSRAGGRGDGRRHAAAGRARALRDVHGHRDRHPGDLRADARAQLPARDRRRLEPRRRAHRDRRLGHRRARLGQPEGHVDAARALVRERVAGGLGAQPGDRRRRASTSTGSARSTPRTAAAAPSRPRPRP